VTIFIKEIHRTSVEDVGFLEGETADGQAVYVRYKYGHLTISVGATIEDAYDNDPVFEKQIEDGGYHITDEQLIEAVVDEVWWPKGFGE
jgi:hypothetical protein